LQRGFQFVTVSQLLGVSAQSAGAALKKPDQAVAGLAAPEKPGDDPLVFVKLPADR
jgi:hypothetical protein